jgi:Fe-Mn family superoxide dismutase
MAFELPALAYAYDALAPHMDARTMEIHHTKHHQAYTTNLNAAIQGTTLEGKTIEEILGGLEEGQLVVVKGNENLRPNQSIKIKIHKQNKKK